MLQRVIYLTLRDLIAASHAGVQFVAADGRQPVAFPRILLYLCDQPEERAVLCLKPGQCAHLCSNCMDPPASLSAPEALTARTRTIVNTFQKQLESARLLQQGEQRQRRLHIDKAVSVSSYFSALAAFAGLTTAPFILYKIIGFDVLHVRFYFSMLLPCPAASAVGDAQSEEERFRYWFNGGSRQERRTPLSHSCSN